MKARPEYDTVSSTRSHSTRSWLFMGTKGSSAQDCIHWKGGRGVGEGERKRDGGHRPRLVGCNCTVSHADHGASNIKRMHLSLVYEHRLRLVSAEWEGADLRLPQM